MRSIAAAKTTRAGFTLIELLIVIVIITLLASLAIGASLSVLNHARNAATKTTISKINSLLAARHEHFHRRYGNSDSTSILRLKNSYAWSQAATYKNDNGSPLNQNQQVIIARKLLYAGFNPQAKSDLTGQPWNLPQSTVDELDNAEILYYMLTKATLFGYEAIGADSFNASEIADRDGDGNMAFIDAWGNDIHFWRWPTMLYRTPIDSTNPADPPHQQYTGEILPTIPRPVDKSLWGSNQDPLARDPGDPLRLLSTVSGFTLHNRNTAFRPLVMSAGPDGRLGVQTPDVDPLGDLTDPFPAVSDPALQQQLIQQRGYEIRDNVTHHRAQRND